MSINPDDVETTRQWGIKVIAHRVVEEISAAAYDAKVPNGQMIERIWAYYKAGGAPIATLSSPPPANPVATLVSLLTAVGSLPEHTPVPREVRALINDYARAARVGLPRLQPGSTAPKRPQIKAAGGHPSRQLVRPA